jgi:hypothetical protein
MSTLAMTPGAWIAVAVAVVIVLALIAWAVRRSARRKMLRERLGPEYDRRIEQADHRTRTERELVDLTKERDNLDIRPLSTAAYERYSTRWAQVQQQFVDSPELACREADTLITEVMRTRGYPVDDFDRRADMVAVDHPNVVEHYRQARRVTTGSGRPGTEQLREAFVHYRTLFDELLERDHASR